MREREDEALEFKQDSIIYALTADCDQKTIDSIKRSNFRGILSTIGLEEVTKLDKYCQSHYPSIV